MQDDAELVRRTRAGEQDVFAEVVRRYQRRLYYFVVGKMTDEGEADDIVQKSFVTAFRTLDTYEAQRPFYAWLRGIALNHCRGEWRRQLKQSRLTDRLLEVRRAELEIEWLNDPEARDEGRTAALRACLEALDETEQSAVQLRFVEELPLKAIAERVRKTAEAARLFLFRIRQRLASCVRKRLATGEVKS